jgi:hypothetical protein
MRNVSKLSLKRHRYPHCHSSVTRRSNLHTAAAGQFTRPVREQFILRQAKAVAQEKNPKCVEQLEPRASGSVSSSVKGHNASQQRHVKAMLLPDGQPMARVERIEQSLPAFICEISAFEKFNARCSLVWEMHSRRVTRA